MTLTGALQTLTGALRRAALRRATLRAAHQKEAAALRVR